VVVWRTWAWEDMAQAGGKWIPAAELSKGLKLLLVTGALVTVDTVFSYAKTETVYNLEVEKHHDFYVSDKSILVHNENNCGVTAFIQSSVQTFVQTKLPYRIRNFIIKEMWDYLKNEIAETKIQEYILKGNFFEDLLGATCFRNLRQTSKYFPFIDFHDKITNKGISVKATDLVDADKIFNQWKNNWVALCKKQGEPIYWYNGESAMIKDIQLIILVPEDNLSAPFVAKLKKKIYDDPQLALLRGKTFIQSVEQMAF
jgi:hypothetical protein